jgi:biotin transport system substrate-specific component
MVGAMIRIPLGTVPFTLQTLFVFLSGLILGPPLGFMAAAVYMAAGLLGLPVFANGGGIMYVLQPSFGYILSFAPAAYVIGLLSHKRKDGSLLYPFACCLLGLLIIYAIGVTYLGVILRLYLHRTASLWSIVYSGALLFVPGDVIGCFIAATVYRRFPKSLLADANRNVERLNP